MFSYISRVWRHRNCLFLCAALVALNLAQSSAATLYSDLPSLNLVTPYALLGGNLNLSNVTVSGDVGVTNNGSLTIMSASYVNGDVDYGTGSSRSIASNTVKGTVNGPLNLASAQAQVFSAAAALANLTADASYAQWKNDASFAGKGGVNVFDVGDVDLNSKTVTLTGTAKDVFIINVAGDFTLGGNGGIIAGTGMSAARILINIVGTGNKVTTKVGNSVEGTLLMANRSAELHSVNGAVYGGSEEIKLMSDASLLGNTFTPPDGAVPEPASMGVAGVALVALSAGARRRCA